jgi:hypothetical protein
MNTDAIVTAVQSLVEGLARGFETVPDKTFTGEQVAAMLRKANAQLPDSVRESGL